MDWEPSVTDLGQSSGRRLAISLIRKETEGKGPFLSLARVRRFRPEPGCVKGDPGRWRCPVGDTTPGYSPFYTPHNFCSADGLNFMCRIAFFALL